MTPPNTPMDFPDEDEIRAATSPAGGFTKMTLRKWGIPWPAPKGWRKALMSRDERFFRRHNIVIRRVAAINTSDDDLFVWG